MPGLSAGGALQTLERHQEALQSYDKALAIDPQIARAWLGRGYALAKLGCYREATESNYKAIDSFLETMEQEWGPTPIVTLYMLVAESEANLHPFIEQRLKQAFGEAEDGWWAKGVPLPIRKKCSERREEDPRRKPSFDYTDLIDLKEILDMSWRCFEGDFQRVKGLVKSKKEFLDNLARLNEILKIEVHPIRDVPTKAELEFARQMREVIQDFVGW